MDILSLAKENPNITIGVRLGDLMEFHNAIKEDIKKEFIEAWQEKENDKLCTFKEAMDFLDKSESTLRRWKCAGYLIPIEVGGTLYYRMSDINKILKRNHV